MAEVCESIFHALTCKIKTQSNVLFVIHLVVVNYMYIECQMEKLVERSSICQV